MNAKEKKAREDYMNKWRDKIVPLLRVREDVIFLGSRSWLPTTVPPCRRPYYD